MFILRHSTRTRTQRSRHGALAFVVLACAAFIGCSDEFPGKPNPADRPLPQNEITDFATLFAQNCTGCHGADGELGPAPPLNDPLFLALIPDEALHAVIRDGRPGTPMPAFVAEQGGALSTEQVKIIAAGLKSHWPADKKEENDPAIVAGAPFYLASTTRLQLTPGATEQAAALFERACAECHGPNGAGGETGYASGGAINDRAFLALISDQALRRIMITGRHDLGMPNYAATDGRPDDFKPLTSEEIDELVALLAAWRRGDAGTNNAGD